MDSFAIGIDIGGTTTGLGFVSQDGALACGTTLPTNPHDPPERLVERISEAVEGLRCGIPPQADIVGIGVGAPNANYLSGTVDNPPNLQWGDTTDLVCLFGRSFGLPVAVTNDANAAAVGELLFGGARGMRNVIVVTLGTGLGSGLIVNGELLYGASGLAGELGHTTVDPAGRECACGRRGCLEAYVSATGLCRTVTELLAVRRGASSLRDVPFSRLTSKLVHEAGCKGDEIALEAFDTMARTLAMKLADAVAHTSPEAIFLSGGLANAGELLMSPTGKYFDGFLLSHYRGTVRLLPSGLPEGSGSVLGAAALAWHEHAARIGSLGY